VLGEVVSFWRMDEATLGRRPRVVILWGADDPWYPASQIDEYRKTVEKTVYPLLAGGDVLVTRVIPAAGHVPQIEKPDEVARAILDAFGGPPEPPRP